MVDAAYFAGLFDGEGYLGPILSLKSRRRDGKKTITVTMKGCIVNTHREVLDWCVQTTGCGHVVQARGTLKSPRNLPAFRYNLDSNSALLWLIPQIRPYLKVKRPQADAVLRFLRSRAAKRRGALTEAELDLVFEARLANQKSYNKGSTEHVLYKKQPYTREEFRRLVQGSRNDSLYRVVEWTPEMDALVGTDIDLRVAAVLGLKLAQVQRRREQLGRPPFGAVTERDRIRIRELRMKGYTLLAIAEKVDLSFSSVQRVVSKGIAR